MTGLTRRHLLAAAACVATCVTSCGRPSHLPPIDLVATLSQAERRPSMEAVSADFVQTASDVAPALLMTAPSRVLYRVTMPARARFVGDVGLAEPMAEPGGVTVRVGLSDGRRYEEVFRRTLDRASHDRSPWARVVLDLSAYSGRQFSVFYRPDRKTWQLVLNADPAPGGRVAWVRPTVEMP